MKKHVEIMAVCIVIAACCVTCEKDATPTGPAATDVVGMWVGNFTFGQEKFVIKNKIENASVCTTTVAYPASGVFPEIPVFITMGTWVVDGNLFKITATKCLGMDTTTGALTEIPVNQSPMGGSKNIPINISGNQWVYTDPQLQVTITCIRQ